ncbi:glycerophosphoryl diester phosphodiesterase [candidate division TM7 genomosp. GTL1]|nr:glycerophosphoryl diester phosphodiesterase [candidate division TM7 genomosp. GTL1]
MKIIAHRGYHKNHPENTLAAFQEALQKGADAIELDAHETKDGQLVVHHDYYLGNPDNGEELIVQRDAAYIRGLRIDDTEKIPLLNDVFELIGNKMQYELELKGFTDRFLLSVIEIVKRFDLFESIEFTSPTVYILTRLKELEPGFKTGFFATPFPGWMDKELGQTILINNALLGRIGVLHCPLEMIDDELLVSAHKHGLKVHAADCNTEEELRKAFELGVDQLSTDELELAVSIST